MTPEQIYQDLRDAKTPKQVADVAKEWLDRCYGREQEGFRYELIRRLWRELSKKLV